jgi:hypothetical protein
MNIPYTLISLIYLLYHRRRCLFGLQAGNQQLDLKILLMNGSTTEEDSSTTTCSLCVVSILLRELVFGKMQSVFFDEKKI